MFDQITFDIVNKALSLSGAHLGGVHYQDMSQLAKNSICFNVAGELKRGTQEQMGFAGDLISEAEGAGPLFSKKVYAIEGIIGETVDYWIGCIMQEDMS